MLELINVQKDYGRFKLNCSLEVKAGCVTGLIGQNGAGKSTTFKAVLGLISVDSGTVKLFSKDIKRLSIEDKQNIGVVLSDSGFSEYLRIEDIILLWNHCIVILINRCLLKEFVILNYH